jgi:ATP-binding cassette subfamily C (CFTR/MRP) protein 1
LNDYKRCVTQQPFRREKWLTVQKVFEAEVMQHNNPIDPNLGVAVKVENATFKWATSEPLLEKGGKGLKTATPVDAVEKVVEKARSSEDTLVGPFMISNLNLSIPRGKLVGVVGPVGSGKSSLLQGVRRRVGWY